MLTREEKIKRICEIMTDNWGKDRPGLIGIEMEHFIIDKKSGERIFYSGERGVAKLLEKLASRDDLEKIEINGHIAGAKDEDMAISIEPGAQFEISLTMAEKISQLEERYKKAMAKIRPTLEEMGLAMVSLGADPVNKVEDIELIPKSRYAMMNDYMGRHGERSRNMMRQTCALQVSIDMFSEADFVKKYRALTAMVPMLYTLFDSVTWLGGKKLEKHNARQEIWRRTDPKRTGIIPGVFDDDFSISKYAEWLLDQIIIFKVDEEGQEISTGDDTTLSMAMDAAQDDQEITRLIDHAIGIVFPDIRVKNFLEIRPMDALPIEYSLGASAMIKGLFYDERVLDKLSEALKDASQERVLRGLDSGRDNGIQGYYMSDYFCNWGLRLLDLAQEGLDAQEGTVAQEGSDAGYLKALRGLWENLESPADYFNRIYREKGRDAFLELIRDK